MNLNIRVFLTGLILALSFGISKSQYMDSRATSDEGLPKTGKIKGKILEKGTGTPMEYANILVYRKKDSTMVTGTISGITGDFEINGLAYGRYYVIADFIGYDKEFIKDVRITPDSRQIDLGTVILTPSVIGIDAVEVVTRRPQVEYKIDKKVVNVSQDLTAVGGTAVDVLENVPSIQTDMEGNISLRGSSNFTVYVDGRPSILEGSDALQQIPASAIESIEIITNPSAKYEAEGTAGIINVIMKKRRGMGLNGLINTTLGSNKKYGADALINYRAESFNLYGGLAYNKRNYSMHAYSYERSWKTTGFDSVNNRPVVDTVYETINRDIENERNNIDFRFGFDYFINDKNTFSVTGEYDIGRGNRVAHSYEDELLHDTETSYYTRSFSKRISNDYDFNLGYISKFDKEGHEFSASFHIEGETGGRDEGLVRYLGNDDQGPVETSYNNGDVNPEYELRLKADYVRPFNEHRKIETGLQFDADQADYDYYFQEYIENVGWQDVDSLNQILDIDRAVYSAYGLFTNRFFWDIDVQAGLRIEYTDRVVKANRDYRVKMPDLFPSLHISKVFNDRNQVMLGYTRRVNRPREWALNPVRRYWDAENIWVGNPALEPEYTDMYEINYQYSIDRSFIAVEFYHRHNQNLIERVREALGDDITLHTSTNVGERFTTGLELMSNLEFKKLLIVNASVSLFNDILNTPVRDENIENERFSWRANLNTTINTPWNGRFQLNGNYEAATITSQGEQKGYFVMDMGYRQDFFNRKLTATLQAEDILQSRSYSGISYLSDRIIESRFERESPVITLTLSYKINNYIREKEADNMNGNGGGGFDGGF